MKPIIADIRRRINSKMPKLKRTYKVKSIGVFGSVARGDSTESSDLDILAEFSEPIGFFKFIELEEFLTRVVGKRVDLVTKQAIKPAIKKDVLQQVIYV